MNDRLWTENAGKLADWTIKHLVNRTDSYGYYNPDPKTKKNGLNRNRLIRHYFKKGERIGLHAYNKEGLGKWIVIDIDAHTEAIEGNKKLVGIIKQRLADRLLGCFVDHSNGQEGYKVWIVFDEPIEFAKLKAFGRLLIEGWEQIVPKEPEVFPKQDSEQKEYGNYVRLPGWHHKRNWVSDIDGAGDESPNRLLAYEPNMACFLPEEELAVQVPTALRKTLDYKTYIDSPKDYSRYKGNLASLDIVALCEENHKIIKFSGGGFYEVVCPQAFGHTTGEGGAFIKNGDGESWASFHCKHAHCAGKFGLLDFLMCFEAQEVDRHCSKKIGDPVLSLQAKLDSLPVFELPNYKEDLPVIAPVEPAKPAKLKAYLIRELCLLPSPKWQVENHITDNSLNVLFGESGQYKSFVSLDMALSIAYGVPYINTYKVNKAKVAYVAAEGAGGIKKRIMAWCKDRGLPLDNENFLLVPEAFDLTGDNRNDEWLRLGTIIMERFNGIELLVIDTVARNFGGGDENAPKDMGQFIKSCDSIKTAMHCSVLAVHHTGNDVTRARGHSSLRGACDTMIHVSRAKGGCIVECFKQKDFEPFKKYILKSKVYDMGIDVNNNPITSVAMHLQDNKKTDWELMDAKDKGILVDLYANFKNERWTGKDAVKKLELAQSTMYKRLGILVASGYVGTADGLYFVTEKYNNR